MAQNNGFYGDAGDFPGNSNQNGFQAPPFTASPGPGRQYSPFPQQSQTPGRSGVDSLNDMQSQHGIFHEPMPYKHPFSGPLLPQYLPPQFNVPQTMSPTPPRATQINARAAELKAQLLKGRSVRASSAAPTATTPGPAAKPQPATDRPSSLRNSPRPSMDRMNHEQALNINELISQYSVPTPTAEAVIKHIKLNSESVPFTQPTLSSALAQSLPLGSSPKVTKPIIESRIANHVTNGKTSRGVHSRSLSTSEMSEGEIPDEPSTPEDQPISRPKETRAPVAQLNTETQIRPKPQDPTSKSTYNHVSREGSHAPQSNLGGQAQRGADGKEEASSPRPEKKSTPSYSDQKARPDSDKQSHPHRESREENEERRRPEAHAERQDSARSARKESLPSLAQVLPYDRDLREWLEITGFHNAPYRDKILHRRRAIAELDDQRRKLVAEMEAEERGPMLVVPDPLTSTPLTVAPPLPSKVVVPSSNPSSAESALRRDTATSNKRSYSDIQDARDESTPGKLQRIEHRGSREEDAPRHSRSGYDAPRRSSTDTYNDSPRQSDERGRRPSYGRDLSPGPRAYESRPLARRRSYDRSFDDDRDDYWRDTQDKDRRPFEIRGGYRGRAFDPNYRGRGRGRGRGDILLSHADVRPDPISRSGSPAYGGKIANSKPFKDPKGFEAGGKGDTRYFIVKSFNEENVLKCIEDSIWTTQAQNGPIFADAFKTCKNVILVFSINRSKAFQGYARMESLPGSISTPDWQKAISWESAGAFRVRWLVVCATRFHRIGHLRNALNENLAVLIGKDGQEVEEGCGRRLVEVMGEEADEALRE